MRPFYPWHRYISILFAIALLGITPIVLAQSKHYTLNGQVLDTDTWQPLLQVKISIPDRPILVYSDTLGNFSLSDSLPIIGLSFSKKDYYDKNIQVATDADRIITYLQREIKQNSIDNKENSFASNETISDSLPIAEIIAQGFVSNKQIFQTAGAISVITQKTIARDNEGSLLPALNTIPGVRVEERSPGSYRIAIRGSNLLRSPFGIRNLKTYWNDIPLTDARGTTAINLLDLQHINSMEIIKGPAASIYGAGNGGVLLLRSQYAKQQENKFEIGTSIGNFGLFRQYQNIYIGTERASIAAQYTHHQSDGYRQHSGFNRNSISSNARFYINNKHTLKPFLLYTDLHYQIPGGLTLDENNANRQQARSDFKAQNASVAQQTLLGGIAYQYESKKWLANVAISGSHTNFDNPFTTNYKTETALSWNSRAHISYHINLGKMGDIRSTIGGEWQQSNIEAGNYGNLLGNKDTLNFIDDIVPMQYLLFAQTELNLPRHWTITIGASQSQLAYRLLRSTYTMQQNRDTLSYAGIWSPRIALLKSWNNKWAIHSSISYGFSPPSLDEIRTSNGNINQQLYAEQGINYETGIRANLLNKRLFVDICAYYLRINDAMTRYTDPNGTVLFQNTGTTNNKGIELLLRYDYLPNKPNNTLKTCNTWLSYTYSQYNFGNYIDKGNNYSGNKLTGTAPHLLVIGIDIALKMGIYASVTHTYTDAIPLNDANTVYSKPFNLLKARIGYQKIWGKLQIDTYITADNLLNEKYSLGNDLNAFADRYYQPSAARNINIGAKIGIAF